MAVFATDGKIFSVLSLSHPPPPPLSPSHTHTLSYIPFFCVDTVSHTNDTVTHTLLHGGDSNSGTGAVTQEVRKA